MFVFFSEFMKNVFRLPFVFIGGLSLEVEEVFQDESILVNLCCDLVAIEVRYHISCYKDSTGFLVHQKANKASGNLSYTSHKKAFEVFCSNIFETCIIDKMKIKRMISLQEVVIKIVQ